MGFIGGAIILIVVLTMIGMVDEYPTLPVNDEGAIEEDSTWLEDYDYGDD